MIKVGEYFIICPRCKRKVAVTSEGNSFRAKCKCGVEIMGDLADKPLTKEDEEKAMALLKEARDE